MPGSVAQEIIDKRTRIAAAIGVALSFLAALMLWVGLGWMIEFYVAQTATDRFQAAVLYGDRAAACINAGIAAEAFEMALVRRAYEKWRGITTDVCRH